MYRRLFGVPDVITDMTRSLEMVETYRLIYLITISGHGKCSGCFRRKTGVPEGYRNPPGSNGPRWALVERERGRPGQEARPLPLSPNRTRKGGGAPLAFPLSHSFLPPPSWIRKGGGKPTWSRFPPPRARLPLGRPPPPSVLYIRGRGAPHRHTS